MITDPDMEILVDEGYQEVYALTYQDAYIYNEVYTDLINKTQSEHWVSMNEFLVMWLENLIAQEHKV